METAHIQSIIRNQCNRKLCVHLDACTHITESWKHFSGNRTLILQSEKTENVLHFSVTQNKISSLSLFFNYISPNADNIPTVVARGLLLESASKISLHTSAIFSLV